MTHNFEERKSASFRNDAMTWTNGMFDKMLGKIKILNV